VRSTFQAYRRQAGILPELLPEAQEAQVLSRTSPRIIKKYEEFVSSYKIFIKGTKILTQIYIAAYHSGLVVIKNMDDFASLFCYAKKQHSVPANK
jgi:GTP cyclohydrolase I